MRKLRSEFRLYTIGKVVCIEDLDNDGACSVTNDAEAVVEYVLECAPLPIERIIYRDSMGVWDELKVKDGRFAGFRPLRETDRTKAIAKARVPTLRLIK